MAVKTADGRSVQFDGRPSFRFPRRESETAHGRSTNTNWVNTAAFCTVVAAHCSMFNPDDLLYESKVSLILRSTVKHQMVYESILRRIVLFCFANFQNFGQDASYLRHLPLADCLTRRSPIRYNTTSLYPTKNEASGKIHTTNL